MATIEKKAWPELFEPILSGKKKYDLRLNDFEVNEGDILVLKEWDPNTKMYTGREISKKVTYVRKFSLRDLFWPREEIEKHGLQILSLE